MPHSLAARFPVAQPPFPDLPLRCHGKLLTNPSAFRRLLVQWRQLGLNKWAIHTMRN